MLGTDRDMTFNPRYYADKSFMLQSEYRQALKNSDVISDFSFLIGDERQISFFIIKLEILIKEQIMVKFTRR